jgi:hypothetical protein
MWCSLQQQAIVVVLCKKAPTCGVICYFLCPDSQRERGLTVIASGRSSEAMTPHACMWGASRSVARRTLAVVLISAYAGPAGMRTCMGNAVIICLLSFREANLMVWFFQLFTSVSWVEAATHASQESRCGTHFLSCTSRGWNLKPAAVIVGVVSML